ncbi:MAG: hypothetical protein HY741_22360 [Chloroflexi bacterium]|nr:hypothetical protein [Chloroflexota bacterium]
MRIEKRSLTPVHCAGCSGLFVPIVTAPQAHPHRSALRLYMLDHRAPRTTSNNLPMRQKLQARGESLFLNVCYVAFTSNPYMQYTNAEEYAEFVLATY